MRRAPAPEAPATDLIAIDTGVWLESILFGGAAEELIQMAVAEQVRLITTESLIEDLRLVLERRLAFSTRAAEAVVEFVRTCADVRPDQAPAAGASDRHARLIRIAETAGADAVFTTERSRIHGLANRTEIAVVSIV